MMKTSTHPIAMQIHGLSPNGIVSLGESSSTSGEFGLVTIGPISGSASDSTSDSISTSVSGTGSCSVSGSVSGTGSGSMTS